MATVPGPPRRAYLAAGAGVGALALGAVLAALADAARLAHLRDVAADCGDWAAFPMPVGVVAGGWVALALFGVGAWLAVGECLRPWFRTGAGTPERRLVGSVLRVALVVLAVAAIVLVVGAAADVYGTHRDALPALRDCGP